MSAIRQFVDPFLQKVGGYLPNVFGAIFILVVGWLLAFLVSKGIGKLLSLIKLDERLQSSSDRPRKFEAFLTRLVYWVMVLCVLMLTLDVLGVSGVLVPVRNMFDKALAMFPNFLAAVLIGVIGFIIAKMLATLVEAVTKGADGLAGKVGLSADFRLSRLLGQLVFIFTFVPILIAALDALRIESIAVPATEMLQALMLAVPNIIGAILIISVAFFLGRFVSRVVGDLLRNMGADGLPEKFGVKSLFTENFTLSKLCGGLILFFIMLAALISAVDKLEMPQMADLLSALIEFAGQIVLGLLILAVGNLIANVAHRALTQTRDGGFVAGVARFAIIGLVLAVGLRAMGIADDIIRLAFGLTLGAVAVAFALSFGLGGREAAGEQMKRWLARLR